MKQLRFAVFGTLAYVALSWAIRFDMPRGEQIASLIYPLDTFSMYARMPADGAGHLLVRDESGNVHRITRFRTYECASSLSKGVTRCAGGVRYHIGYHHDDLLNYITQHPGPGEMDVELISRSWRLPIGEKPQEIGDCVIARCRVGK